MTAPVPFPAALARGPRRRLWLGLLTVLGLSQRGFFIPHRHADARPAPGCRLPYPAIESLLAECEPQFQEVLHWLDAVAADLARIGTEPADGNGPAPRWAQSWFPRLDAAVAYTLVRRFAPRRIIEVGSGHSTRFVARAIADGNSACRITAIDPAPRADISKLSIELRRQSVQDLAPEDVADLRAGDFLIIDSSHVLMPGSDVDFLLGRVLPALPTGVFVHFHDIFLPDDYPATWDWRGYNEQLGVLPLLCGSSWDVMFASHYVATRMTGAVAESTVAALPLPPDVYESSLWIRAR